MNDTANTKPLPPLQTRLVVFVVGLVAAGGLGAKALVKQPDLLFLGDFGMIVFWAVLPLGLVAPQLDWSNLSGSARLALGAYVTFAAAMIGLTIYAEWPQWVAAFGSLS